MADGTGIQWTDATWNPVRGCSRISEGCRNCYAEKIAARFSGPGQAYEGLARRRSNGEAQWTGEVRVMDDPIMLLPLKWSRPRRIFTNSMSDLFHEQLVVDDIAHIFAVMALASWHTFQVLTKRADSMQEILSNEDFREILDSHITEIAFQVTDPHKRRTNDLRAIAPDVCGDDWPLKNVWLGVSVENQDAANERIPFLASTPAAIRFLSCEPLLGPLDFEECGSRGAEDGDPFAFSALRGATGVEPAIPGIDWAIIGGESGRGARPFHIDWARSIIAQCRRAGTAPFVKQLGADPRFGSEAERLDLKEHHGGDWDEWAEDLRVREFPETPAVA